MGSAHARFDDIFTDPENSIFNVVFFPDRIYHAQYLNATRSPRYRYDVREVRSKHDVTVLKGQVYMDGMKLCNFLRIEYRASRLVEQVREAGRLLHGEVIAWIRLANNVEEYVKLHYDRWIDAYQVELWETLEPPAGCSHDYRVLDLMGYNRSINSVRAFRSALHDINSLTKVELAFRENDFNLPFGYRIDKQAQWDKNYTSSHQELRVDKPSASENTISDQNYLLDFQRGWFIPDANQITPVQYHNAMMDTDNPDAKNAPDDNIVKMRWIIQRELGSTVVFFHQVTITPGAVEGTHQHIGSEELYYIIEGEGIAYMGEHDDPTFATSNYKSVERHIYGLEPHMCKELPVKPGSVIYTKSGGIHGIRNTGTADLKFVAFLYHAS